jgi:nitric oxide dioxygenase
MNQAQIQHVQNSFEKVKPIADTAADLFYGRLFELDPSLRPYFKGDLSEQKNKLMTALAFVVAGLDRLETILPAVQSLGKRHVGYGVQDAHYETVGATLLWTLAQGLGEQFTPDVKTAWTEAYALLAGVMQEAAHQVEHSPIPA